VDNVKNIILSIFVPCLNEEENITTTLNNIKDAVQNIEYEILIVDDASKDNTVKIIEDFKKKNSSLDIKIFKNKINKGLGYNYRNTIHKASGKYYMNVHGDATEPPKTIREMINNIGKADIIMSYFDFNCKSIFVKSNNRPFIRRLISRLFVHTINFITFNNIKYYNGPSIHLVENIKLYKGKTNGFGLYTELIIFLLKLNKTYLEVLVECTDRQRGTSNAVTLSNILSVGKTVFLIFLGQFSYIFKKIIK
tara:strand:+ start:127 stop:879 length:753 start_codon:yes stop_codon:yes gene_type:complete